MHLLQTHEALGLGGVSDAMTTDSQEVMDRVKNLVSGSGANHKKKPDGRQITNHKEKPQPEPATQQLQN